LFHPFRVLRAKPLWIADGVITGVLALLFTVFYVGANVDPVGLVNADKGATAGGKQVNLGAQITGSIKKSTAGGDKIDWKVMDEKKAKEELGKGELFGALVVPADFTSSTTALTGTATTKTPVCPTLTVVTNQSAGSMGSGLARTATTQAAENASLQVGRELTAQTSQAQLPAAARVLLADPAAVTVEDGHPLDSHSGLGLTAFYYALALVVVGMLSANVISGQVDHHLGYTHNDLGPLRLHRPLIRATRVQTLAVSSTLMIRDRCALPPCRLRHARHAGGHAGLHRDGGADGRRHHPHRGAARLLPLPRGVRAAAADHRRSPLDPLLRRPGRRGPGPGLGDDGRRPRGGRPVRLRHDRLVRPQGAASHPGRDEAGEDRRPGVAERTSLRAGPGREVRTPAPETAPAHPENRSVFISAASS
jgi:YhgE/Pip-like protein